MKIQLIQPFVASQALFAQTMRGLARFSGQLGPPVLAALTPGEYDIELVNEQIERVDCEKPVDLVGISTTTANITRAYEIADAYRAKGVTVIMGGIHASFLPDEAGEHCDAVVMGEAEYVWEGVLEDWRKGALKPRYKADRLSEMEDVPVPRRDLDMTVGYTDKIEASRGCPFDCDFCSTNLHFGRRHRTRPIRRVLEDLRSIHRHKVHAVLFTDDNIIGNPGYAKHLFDALRPLNLQWLSQCSLNIADNPELLRMAAGSGCVYLSLGFESLSAANLEDAKKLQNKVKQYDEQVRKIKDAGIEIVANFVFGFDGDDKSVFERTVDFVQRNGVHAYFAILTPYPSTRLRARLLEEGRVLHSDWSRYDVAHCVIRPKRMTPEELEEGFLWAYQQVYPGKVVLAEDVEDLHKDYRLSAVSRLVLKIEREEGNGSGGRNPKGLKALFGDVILEPALRERLVRDPAGFVREEGYAIEPSKLARLEEELGREGLNDLLALEKELAPNLLEEYRGMGLFG